MSGWSTLRQQLAAVDDRKTYTWANLDVLVGGLPNSAYSYGSYWSGNRPQWRGFTATDVHVGQSVTFVRRSTSATVPLQSSRHAAERYRRESHRPNVVLVACVKRKLDHPARARDLYTSPLFRKQRAYAEGSGVPWFVLSAKHGLVDPEEILEPYDVRLSLTTSEYRRRWGQRVVAQMRTAIATLDNTIIEIHAGAPYIDPIRELLHADGADVVEPLHGLKLGDRLAWYKQRSAHATVHESMSSGSSGAARLETKNLAQQLVAVDSAWTPSEFLASQGAGMKFPGMYSWWVDPDGAADLANGLGHPVAPGLIYVGLAGATRARSHRKSTNTLWDRIATMHLGRRHDLSTLRLSLGSVLSAANGDSTIDEDKLTKWMFDHLRVITVPVADRDLLGNLESQILQQLNPTLNLRGVPPSSLRAHLTQLRRRY